MKSIIDAWHPVHTEARRGPQFSEFARDASNSGTDGDLPLSAPTAKALALLTKDTKSVSKALGTQRINGNQLNEGRRHLKLP